MNEDERDRRHEIYNRIGNDNEDEIEIPECAKGLAEVFCGCGEPHTAWETVHQYLKDCSDWTAAINEDQPFTFTRAWHNADKLNKETPGPVMITLYLLDYLGLTEHGSSVGGSWLTEKGTEVLNFLEEITKKGTQ